MYILPAIDLKDGRCVRLTQGRKADAKIYDADPLDVARAFASSGDMIHIVDPVALSVVAILHRAT